MFHNLDPREPGNDSGREQLEKAPVARPVSDREVPLTGRRTPPSVHAWLDGELPEAAARLDEAERDVDFWRRVEHEARSRRQVRTPVYVYQQIMDALPQATPQVITPWWRRPIEVTPAAAIALTAALLAAGALLGATLLRLR